MIQRVDKITASSLNQNKPKKYSDFTVNFDIHPSTGDLFLLTNENAVKTSLTNIIKTNFYERRFKETVGTNVRAQLFEQLTGDTLTEIAGQIRSAITTFEKRVTIVSLQVTGTDSNPDAINVSLLFNVANIPGTSSINVIVNRVR